MAASFSADTREIDAFAAKAPAAAPILRRNMTTAARKAGFIALGGAKIEAPVDTGALRAQIHPDPVKVIEAGVSVEVISSMEYSIYVHDGTRYMDANPYMDRGLARSTQSIQQAFDQALTDTMREMGFL